MTEFAGAATPLSDADIAEAAARLDVDVALIAAVAEVESAGAGFLPDKRPKILFERHVFSRRTSRRFDHAYPSISNPRSGGYGASGAYQYTRLAIALDLNRTAALESASWGRFQCMGFNAELCGWPNVEAFVADMCRSEAEHLKAFIGYCQATDLFDDLEAHDWRAFTRGYNGPGNVDAYAPKLEAAYRKHAARRPLPPVVGNPVDDPVELCRRMQRALGVEADGWPGDYTMKAMREWRQAHSV